MRHNITNVGNFHGCIIFIGSLFLLRPSYGDPVPELMIVANRVPTQVAAIGRSTESVPLQGTPAINLTSSLADALAPVAGINSLELGGPGSPGVMPLEVRGFRSGGAKVLLNGMTLDDPSSVSGNFESFYSHLNLADMQKVEILKGSAGVLYGSDAQSGALNFIPLTPQIGESLKLQAEGGAYETYSGNIQLNNATENLGLFASLWREDSSGLDTHGNYDNTSLLINTMAQVNSELKISPIVRIINTNTDLDNSPTVNEQGQIVPNQDTATNYVDADAYFVGLATDYEINASTNTQFNVYHNHTERSYYFEYYGFPSYADYSADSFHLENQTVFSNSNKTNTFLVGWDYNNQHVSTDADAVTDSEGRDIYGAYLHDSLALIPNFWVIAAGARLSHVSDISETFPTLELSSSLQIPATHGRLHSSIAQGFRAPTLFESKGNMQDFNTGEIISVGNDSLEKEESISWDTGYEQTLWADRATIDVTFFQINSDQTILFDYATYSHYNGGEAVSQGIETSANYKITRWLSSKVAYTYLDRAQGSDQERRARAPWNWATWQLSANYADYLASATLKYRGAQEIEFYGLTDRVTENDAFVTNLYFGYQLTSETLLYLQGNNVFNEHYTEAGYRMPAASYYVGVKVML